MLAESAKRRMDLITRQLCESTKFLAYLVFSMILVLTMPVFAPANNLHVEKVRLTGQDADNQRTSSVDVSAGVTAFPP